MKKISFLFIYILVTISFSCSGPTITDDLLDGEVVFDPSLYNPEQFLVSAKYPIPTPADLNKHIILAVHGYTATTFEWQEFQDWSVTPSYRISQVLLGGHGRDYNAFKNSTWEDWRSSITSEYEKLIALGYTRISLVGSSTGGTLLLELVNSGYFNNHLHPKNIFLVDPIVVPSNKLQTLVGIIGPMIVYVETDQTAAENNYWYRFRPYETINELNNVMSIVRKGLENGMTLPSGTYLKVFHSLHDPVASTTSSVLIYKGLKTSSGSKIEVQLIYSDIHVFTRLNLRTKVTLLQKNNQLDVFNQIANKLN
ncbi:alpha/beta hydrolase [Flavobacterium cellulosilyticum]|uniref:Esterase n=1 Tax=Flavobacterium cellulosilyticum TaxID=2541731 RepID=A0A4R5CHD7_9FLAO|nr:esterase [Flavobacterium cellulosilyticum]TDD99541.1 esterase [Flavobacterium cellulosilyticum]